MMAIGNITFSSAIDWFPGEPNNGPSYNCLVWDGTTNKLMDYACWGGYPYICEHPRMHNFNISHKIIYRIMLAVNQLINPLIRMGLLEGLDI